MKNTLQIMEKERVSSALLKLGIPTMIGMVISALYNLVDAYFVGQLGTMQLAAVSIVFPITMAGTGIALLFGSGGGTYIARLLGKKEYAKVKQCNSTLITAGVLTMGLIVVFVFIFFDKVMFTIGATTETIRYVKQYGYLFIFGLLFNVFNIISNNIINSEGASFFSMIVMLTGGICNVILDPIFIFWLHLGVEGAAIATLISRIIAAILYAYYFMYKTNFLKFSITQISIDKNMFKETFKIGIPIMVFQLLSFVTLSLINIVAKKYGSNVIAAVGIVNRIFTVEGMLIFGFIKGYQPFVAYNFGNQNYARINQATKTALRWTTLVCISLGLLAIFFLNKLYLFLIPHLQSWSTLDIK